MDASKGISIGIFSLCLVAGIGGLVAYVVYNQNIKSIEKETTSKIDIAEAIEDCAYSSSNYLVFYNEQEEYQDTQKEVIKKIKSLNDNNEIAYKYDGISYDTYVFQLTTNMASSFYTGFYISSEFNNISITSSQTVNGNIYTGSKTYSVSESNINELILLAN